MRWSELVQRIRAFPPSSLLPVIARESAALWTGGAFAPTPGGFQPWVLASIARESLAYSNEHRTGTADRDALARLHDLFMDLHDPFTEGEDGPFDAVLRIAYEQLDWQQSPLHWMGRFAVLFDRDFPAGMRVLNQDMLVRLLGASVRDTFAAAMLFGVGSTKNEGQYAPDWLTLPHFAEIRDVLGPATANRIFAQVFSAEASRIAGEASRDRHPVESLRRLDPNPLRRTPLVTFDGNNYIAPST